MKREYDEDELYAEHRQLLVDDETEARVIEASLQDAYIEGQRAGHINLAAEMNPYQDGYPEHAAWERGRSCVIGAWLNGSLRKIS